MTAIVSTVAAHAAVRAEMVRAQRRIAQDAPVVMAGRDIGTVVLPDAPVKIFLTASVAARIARRRLQLERGGVDVDVRRLGKDLKNATGSIARARFRRSSRRRTHTSSIRAR